MSRAGRLATVLVLMGLTAACGSLSSPPTTFDLTAPEMPRASRGGARQVVVVEPDALQVINSDRIVVSPKPGIVTYLAGAQWADRLPSLVQTRLIQTFENGTRLASVGGPEDRIVPDVTLVTAIRTFGIDAAQGMAVVEMSAKLVTEGSGRVEAAKLFSARVPSGGTSGPQAAAALDLAQQDVLRQIVLWASPRV
jgi:cholesterol transport system auxiliary component